MSKIDIANSGSDEIKTIELTNANGMKVGITNVGAAIMSIHVPDKDGKLDDVVLGFKNPADYLDKNGPYMGVIAGRYANRIKEGRFDLNGRTYDELAINNSPNHLHGGDVGFGRRIWQIKSQTENSVTLFHHSKHGEDKYPATVDVEVTYTLTPDNKIHIRTQAKNLSDKLSTHINLAGHSYFNLGGEGGDTIDGHIVSLNSKRYTPVDKTQIPTGELAGVEGTPFNFLYAARLGDRLHNREIMQHPQMEIGNGYDINFELNRLGRDPNELATAARMFDPVSRRMLVIKTTEPGLQLYTGQHLPDNEIPSKTRPGKYPKRGGVCFEPQHFPDTPNQRGNKDFPSTELRPKDTYTSETVYEFSVEPEQGKRRSYPQNVR